MAGPVSVPGRKSGSPDISGMGPVGGPDKVEGRSAERPQVSGPVNLLSVLQSSSSNSTEPRRIRPSDELSIRIQSESTASSLATSGDLGLN